VYRNNLGHILIQRRGGNGDERAKIKKYLWIKIPGENSSLKGRRSSSLA